jgi:two-component system response regulator HydG
VPSQIHQDVLLATDCQATTRLVLEVLAARGLRGTVVRDGPTAIERIDQRPWDLVIVDLPLPGGDLAVVRQAKQRYPETPVIVLSADTAVPLVVLAMREGCHDVLTKPLDRAAVEAILAALFPQGDVPLAAAEEADSRCLLRIVGRSPRLAETLAVARKVAPTSLPVLITGESGTGKELVSFLVHRASRRAQGPYIRVNCAALSETLLESELFGHERGAFTGAHVLRKGRFERAHGGTLLLDEVSETGPRLQAELLRVLEQQDFERVGGSEPISVNVRIISTTNRNLAEEVQRGRFRADLYWRLAGVRISVPPLRERREDIPILVRHFVSQFAHEVGRRITQLDPKMMDLFLASEWSGNIRMLRNVVRTALVMGDGPVLSLTGAPWLPSELAAAANRREARTLCLRDVERRTILEAMRLTRSHQARAARLLGITDRTLREKLRRYREEPTETPASAADIADTERREQATDNRQQGWNNNTVVDEGSSLASAGARTLFPVAAVNAVADDSSLTTPVARCLFPDPAVRAVVGASHA